MFVISGIGDLLIPDNFNTFIGHIINMLFNSFQFLIFFPVVTLLYFLLPYRFRWLHLLIASCVFYMVFIPQYILILFFTIVIDYIAGIMIEKEEGPRRRLFLILSIAANVGVLAVFKYYNFFTENINTLLAALHVSTHPLPLLKIILPLGLSFHTFQAMSYTIEIYRENQKAERHFGIYALYVMFYPQLVAGPIERPQNILHQFYEKHDFDPDRVASGLRLMLVGFFKKIVLADRLALFVNNVYNQPDQQNGLTHLIAAIFFCLQVYFDFSGYSDIARGSARVMGFELMLNFNRPFFALRLSDYWRRWHISLYSWFTDYVFVPLSMQWRRWGTYSTVISILITFSLSGLWHGAAWTYVIWGLLHGVGLSVEILTKNFFKPVQKSVYYNNICRIITLTFVVFTGLVFRASDLHELYHDFCSICTGTLSSLIQLRHGFSVLMGLGLRTYSPITLIALFTTSILFLFAEYYYSLIRVKQMFFASSSLRMVVYFVLLYAVVFFGYFGEMQFIYFQF